MAQLLCPKCGKRMINQKILEAHLKKSHSEEAVVAEVKEAPKAEAPVETAPAQANIILYFKQAVEVTINGIPYHGKIVEAPNMSIASEIIRIAKEAYGNDILAE